MIGGRCGARQCTKALEFKNRCSSVGKSDLDNSTKTLNSPKF